MQFHLRVLFVSRHRVAAQCRFLFLQCNCYSFSSIFFLWSKNPPLSARTRGIPCEARAQRGVRRGRELSDCRHLGVGLSLINDGNIPPYTVTRLRPARDPHRLLYINGIAIVPRRCAAFLPAFTVSTTAADKKRAPPIGRISADLRFSAKSFSARRSYINCDHYFENNLRQFHAL